MATGFSSQYIDANKRVDWAIIRSLFTHSKDDTYIIAGWIQPTYFVLQILLALMGRKIIIWTDTPHVHRARNPLKAFLRSSYLKFLFPRLQYLFLTGKVGVQAGQEMGMAPSKTVNFPWATDTRFFHPDEQLKRRSDKVLFIASGRIDFGHKGQDTMVKALHQVKQEGFNNFECHLAGEGADRPELERLIAEYGLEEEVKLLGWLEPQEIKQFYQSADVLLHPSHFDPFPNAVLEAMACGLPVIGSLAAGSVSDRVVDGENGFTHEAGDAEGLANQLRKVLAEPELLTQLSVNSRATAERWEVSYHLDILEQVMNNQAVHAFA